MDNSTIFKKLLANISCFIFLFIYSIFGGVAFLYFEKDKSNEEWDKLIEKKFDCIDLILQSNQTKMLKSKRITEDCIIGILDPVEDRRKQSWNFRNAFLYGFGILTTLGYGKIEPETTQAQLFTVVWGFFGVPFTVIILTNFGLFMRRIERYLRKHYCQTKQKNGIFNCLKQFIKCEYLIKLFGFKNNREEISLNEEDEETISLNPWFYEDEEFEDEYETKQISPFTLATIVFIYLAIGAILLPLLQGCFQFIDGLFYSYLCFTAIEYGHLIPENNLLIPIVLIYMCIGLVLSTIALDVGSNYVRSLYYLGKQATSIAHTTFFYGSKTVTVKDLINAVGQAIGMSPDSMEKVDMNRMVGDAIAVKEGQLNKVGQNYMFLEGIWPPELIPLFQRDGDFPSWVDADELKRYSIKTPIITNNGLINQKHEDLAPILSLSTYSNGYLHRSLYSTSSTSNSSKEKKKKINSSIITDKNNNNNENNYFKKDLSNIPFI
ncbi:hypothetical protein Mgra_00005059 [Meloidogyne graminicola]|uniref:Potassium channel domain-containing protein n=1 Tax=Meloidogyne graminicola TaxID=189291 RepID=A0A8S9ZPL1_9BILA|nr:hypothetical protein Mgra_00005059 [Meloidogyne graminicola]